MNNKVNFLRGTSTEYAASTKDNDTFYYTTDTKKLYLGRTEITSIEVDDTSTTATDKTWSAKKISDSIPTTLPANGGNADTIDGLGTDVIPHGYQTLYDNANQCTKSGYYMLNSTALNIPVATFGLLVVSNGDYANADATWAVQTFYLTSNGDAYRRMYVNGKFTTWVNIADGGNAASVGGKTITVTDVDPGAGSALSTGAIVFVTEVT